jgi:hypothetical protein
MGVAVVRNDSCAEEVLLGIEGKKNWCKQDLNLRLLFSLPSQSYGCILSQIRGCKCHTERTKLHILTTIFF